MAPVNVLLAGLPGARTINLRIGDHRFPLRHEDLTSAINCATGLRAEAFYLCQAGALLHPRSVVTRPGEHTAFINLFFRRALPGGKGGFGALLKGSSGTKKTTNFDSCRDLQGRRLRDVRREQALRTALNQSTEQTAGREVNPASPHKRKRVPTENETVPRKERLGDTLENVADEVQKAVASGFRSLAARRKRRRVSDTPPLESTGHSQPTAMEWMKAYDDISSDSESDSSVAEASPEAPLVVSRNAPDISRVSLPRVVPGSG
ncbi:Protein SDE2-like [Gracilariopsis chorda]|uniref:Protein SDE2-like n=1 Tax=Gracilariopsis chorda TaxID=448386 RepID=A0A2V3J3V3_9FLOR|nr:Protein SDE2-like [Gracilariopsis chorda]|eukprot:PXF48667.1 Protein SDE2-like [Gracilariopsis chorda]